MFFFNQNLESILRRQKLWTFIEMAVLPNQESKGQSYPHLVQVVTNNSISDGVYDYPCHFTCQSFRKGSYLRMIKWEVDMFQYKVVIHQAQYLGGAGCEVKHGKIWDIEKMKCIHKSNVYSKNFVVLMPPNAGVDEQPEDFEQFTIKTLKKRLIKGVEKEGKMDQMTDIKRRIPVWAQEIESEN